jgi:hypothetical protein
MFAHRFQLADNEHMVNSKPNLINTNARGYNWSPLTGCSTYTKFSVVTPHYTINASTKLCHSNYYPLSTLRLLDKKTGADMLIILLIFALSRTLRGVPFASPSDPFPALALRDAQSHFGQRTVNEIVISCLATIFACTWSAIHPNIPAVTDSKWTCFKRRVTITICALLAPELVTFWAMRQRLGAKEIMERYNKGP